nr:unnamed protein product [Digitaria exilis]
MAVRSSAIAAMVALALLCGTASAQGFLSSIRKAKQPPKMSTPGNPKQLPPKGKYTTVVANKYHKRDYEITCTTDFGTSCYIKCPARCPNNFCLVTDDHLHINARFMGNHNAESGRDFTWVQSLGITFDRDDHRNHSLYIGARRAAEWDEDEDHVVLVLDGEPVDVEAAKNARWVSGTVPGLSVTRTHDVNAVTVELDGVFSVSANAVPITDEESRVHSYGKTEKDSLVHLDVGYTFHGLTKDVDGVLGQTYRPNYVNKLDITAKMPIMGGEERYRSSGLFATDCAVSRFHRVAGHSADGFTSFAS